MSVDTIAQWISTFITDIPVIISHQNAPAPDGDYINVAFVSSEGSPYPHIDKHYVGDDDVRFTADNPTVLSVDVTSFSADGYIHLNDIKNHASLPPYRDRPVMADAGTIRGPAFFNDSGFSPQYTCEYQFRVGHITRTTDPRVQNILVVGFLNGDPITIDQPIAEPEIPAELGDIMTDEGGNILIDNDGAILTENVGD